MNIASILLGPQQSRTGSSYAIAAVGFPMSIIFLSNAWAHHESLLIAFWVALTALYVVRWPIATIGRLIHLRMSRLWILPLLIPVVLLVAASLERWRILALVATLVSLGVQAPLVFPSLRMGSPTTEDIVPGETQP